MPVRSGRLNFAYNKVVVTVAGIINRNPGYRLLIEGFANPVYGTAQEERESLKPLSVNRAREAADWLAKQGVDRRQIVVVGEDDQQTAGKPKSESGLRVDMIILSN
ncbi:MAG: OmpA family protein [Spirochaetaceae bacterium]|jgi:outer membrane protein OmpA-like peptidoglycan-associated protein|nr:OmpA family protein [Spirochaetaceae bacterium]